MRLCWGLAESAFDGSLKSGVRCPVCVGSFGRNMVSVAGETFSHLICFTKKCHNFCIFNEICKDNSAKNALLFKTNKKKFIPVNFYGCHYASGSIILYLLTCLFQPLYI